MARCIWIGLNKTQSTSPLHLHLQCFLGRIPNPSKTGLTGSNRHQTSIKLNRHKTLRKSKRPTKTLQVSVSVSFSAFSTIKPRAPVSPGRLSRNPRVLVFTSVLRRNAPKWLPRLHDDHFQLGADGIGLPDASADVQEANGVNGGTRGHGRSKQTGVNDQEPSGEACYCYLLLFFFSGAGAFQEPRPDFDFSSPSSCTFRSPPPILSVAFQAAIASPPTQCWRSPSRSKWPARCLGKPSRPEDEDEESQRGHESESSGYSTSMLNQSVTGVWSEDD